MEAVRAQSRLDRARAVSAAHLLPAGIAGLIATVAAAWTIGYPGRDLRQPLIYAGDELAGLGHVTGVDESGWWFVNPRLGAPFSLEHYDFPQHRTLFPVPSGNDAPKCICELP